MIYEIRTYDLKPRSLPEFEKRTAEKISGRVKYSQLGGYWRTEVGPLNQVVHIWPYEDLNKREEIRAKAVAEGEWPPDNAEFTLEMRSEIYNPAPFMTPSTASVERVTRKLCNISAARARVNRQRIRRRRPVSGNPRKARQARTA